jgi:hypothetical protein
MIGALVLCHMHSKHCGGGSTAALCDSTVLSAGGCTARVVQRRQQVRWNKRLSAVTSSWFGLSVPLGRCFAISSAQQLRLELQMCL